MDTATALMVADRLAPARTAAGSTLGAFLANKRSECTRRAYGADIIAFARFLGLGGEASKDPGAVARAILGASVGDVIAWRDSMSEPTEELPKGQAPASIARRVASVRMFFRFAKASGVAGANPAEGVECPRVEAARQRRPYLEADEARRLLDAPDTSTVKGKRDRAILGLLASSGLRRAEVCGIAMGDVRQEASGLTLTVQGKGGKVRTVDVDRETAEALVAYLEADGRPLGGSGSDLPEPLFRPLPNPGNGGECNVPLSIRSVNAIADGYATRAGLAATPHALRRTFATVALDRGATIEALRRTMGHADPRTTARYDRRHVSTVTVAY